MNNTCATSFTFRGKTLEQLSSDELRELVSQLLSSNLLPQSYANTHHAVLTEEIAVLRKENKKLWECLGCKSL
jgi:hypothetical protein